MADGLGIWMPGSSWTVLEHEKPSWWQRKLTFTNLALRSTDGNVEGVLVGLGETTTLFLQLVALVLLFKGSAMPGHRETWLVTSVKKDDWPGLDCGRPRQPVHRKHLDAGLGPTLNSLDLVSVLLSLLLGEG